MGVAQLLRHSQKVFEIGSESRFGICTWGAGSFGNISHRTIVARLAEEIGPETTVEEATQKLKEIVEPIAHESRVSYVGYYLGGSDPKSHNPACYKIEFFNKDGQNISTIKELQLGQCEFSGTSHFFTRVFYGFDPSLRENLWNELYKVGMKDAGISRQQFDEAFNRSYGGLIVSGFADLPIREAIDFIYSYLHITVKAEKFKFGSPTCGGPIEVGFISTDRPFRWVCHKGFTSAIYEQKGEYDVE